MSGGQGACRQLSAAVRFAHTHTCTQCLCSPPASVTVLMLSLCLEGLPLLPVAFPEARGYLRTLTPSSSFQLLSSIITDDKLLLLMVHG